MYGASAVVAWCLHEKQLFVQNTSNLMTMLTQVSCSFEVSLQDVALLHFKWCRIWSDSLNPCKI